MPTVVTAFFRTSVLNSAPTRVHHRFRSSERRIQSSPLILHLGETFCCHPSVEVWFSKAISFFHFFPNKFLGTSLLSHSLQTPRSSIPSLEHHNNLWWGTQIMQGKMANDNFSQQSVQLSSVYTAKLAVSATDNLLYKLWMDFQQIWFLGTSLKFLDIFIFMLTQNINNGHFTGRHACLFALTFSVPRNTSQPITFRKK